MTSCVANFDLFYGAKLGSKKWLALKSIGNMPPG